MHLVFLAARIFPFWALAFVLVLGELGRFFRRRGANYQYHCFGAATALLILIGAWFYFRGDKNSDEWVRTLISSKNLFLKGL
jgi:hypothetical protein